MSHYASIRFRISCEIQRDPGRSDRQIAALFDVHHETVGAVRRSMQPAVQAADRRTDTIGRRQRPYNTFRKSAA